MRAVSLFCLRHASLIIFYHMSFPKKGTKLYSILKFKCPKCNEGDLFDTPTFSFKKPFSMPEQCPHCQQAYRPEPGFYYGAMFVSYIITGWFSIGFVLFFHWVLDWSMSMSFGLLILILGLLFVFVFRFSRAVWIALMVQYDPSHRDKKGH